MTWIAVLLIGVAVADLAHSIRPVPIVNECTGAAVAVWLGLMAGLTEPADLAALAVIAVAVVGYGLTVTRAFGGGRSWVPLLVLGGSLLLAVLCSGWASAGWRAGGGLARRGAGPRAAGAPGRPCAAAPRGVPRAAEHRQRRSSGWCWPRPTRSAPQLHATPGDPAEQLKGGRLLGPMERVLILGLGLAGQLTAAAIVIAAKGLLRWPELQSKPEQVRIHRLTEYFLVGQLRQLAGGPVLAGAARGLSSLGRSPVPRRPRHVCVTTP